MTNRLADETSPYLLQHRDNPVHWQPWDDAALAEAKAENKPILLSVGYAACHWCHVMAHECFENPDIAAQMNSRFVNIKVDREERPDLDTLYQTALAVMGEHGGWPLTMFLTPDLQPFWGGTYFPPTPRYGRPGFPQILEAIADTYATDPEKVAKNVAAVGDAVAKATEPQTGGRVTRHALDDAAAGALRMVDPLHGGTAGAPKFPQASFFQMLWNAYVRTGSPMFRQAVEITLNRICQGGIYDHVGGGFARYSTDARWLAPHFEKMLYDNALLVDLLTQVWARTGSRLYAERIAETVDWLLRDMKTGPKTGPVAETDFAFASAYDADSEGEEGKFYVWSEAEIDALLGDDAALFKQAYDVTPNGNWEGHTILNRTDRPAFLDDADERVLARCRAILLKHRATRVPPEWDDKVLADWNGLAIQALARAGAAFDQPGWIAAAETAFRFIETHMTDPETGRLIHAWRDGRARHPSTLEDHANLARAALFLFEATGEGTFLTRARALVDAVEAHFADAAGGGYFLAAADTPHLLHRTKPIHDNATPAGNGTMLDVLARLHALTGDADLRVRAESLIQAFAAPDPQRLAAQPLYVCAVEMLDAAVQVVVVGDPDDARTQALTRAYFAAAHPRGVLYRAADPAAIPDGHPAHGKGLIDGAPAAYVCVGPVCGLPVTAPQALTDALTHTG
jgi:uncharacterized protein YyaL (SSP411 family)